jgi:uncharacterized protein (DUF1697 family)
LKERYIAFLRGVNVGGRFVKKDVLSGVFGDAGLAGVRTHIASGNVSFDEPARANRDALARKLEKRLLEAAGYEIPVFLRTAREVERTLRLDPFKGVRVTPGMRPCIIFVSQPLPAGAEIPYRCPKGAFELLRATPGEVFAFVYSRDGQPGNPGAYLEKTYGIKVTVRFFNTTAKILAAATSPK